MGYVVTPPQKSIPGPKSWYNIYAGLQSVPIDIQSSVPNWGNAHSFFSENTSYYYRPKISYYYRPERGSTPPPQKSIPGHESGYHFYTGLKGVPIHVQSSIPNSGNAHSFSQKKILKFPIHYYRPEWGSTPLQKSIPWPKSGYNLYTGLKSVPIHIPWSIPNEATLTVFLWKEMTLIVVRHPTLLATSLSGLPTISCILWTFMNL